MKTAILRSVRILLAVVFIVVSILSARCADSVDAAVTSIADRLGKTLSSRGKLRLTVLDFTDIEGRSTEFGRLLAEQLSVELVSNPMLSVVDRANLKSILAEHKLSEEGLVNPDTAKKLGQFAGVDAIVVGTIMPIDGNYSVTVKTISTESAAIVAAAKANIAPTRETQKLEKQELGSGSKKPPTDLHTLLVTRQLGPLRVALTSVERGRKREEMQNRRFLVCRFEVTNTNSSERVLCAVNAQANTWQKLVGYARASADQYLDAIGCSGIGSVHVVGTDASASSIADVIMSGFKLLPGRLLLPHQIAWEGSMSTLNPGETIQSSIGFGPITDEEFDRIDKLRFEVYLVVGTGYKSNVVAMPYDEPASATAYAFAVENVSTTRE